MRANNNARLGVPWLVCLRVCPSVCLLQPWVLQNGWTDWSVVCGINSAGPREHCFRWGDWKRKYGKRKYRRMEYASTENVSTNEQGWKMQVRKTQVRICNGGKRKYGNLKSILKSLRYSTLVFSVDPLSVGLDQFTCTVPDQCYTQEIGLMLDSCAEGPGFINRRRDAVE